VARPAADARRRLRSSPPTEARPRSARSCSTENCSNVTRARGASSKNPVLRNHEAGPSPRSGPCRLAWRARRWQRGPSESGFWGILA
jgi:hypothetical protein